MSGELTIKRSGGWRKAAALGITAAVILLIMLPMARMLSTRLRSGLMTQIGIAVLVPVLARRFCGRGASIWRRWKACRTS